MLGIFANNKNVSSVENLKSLLSVQGAPSAWPVVQYVNRLWDSLSKARVIGHSSSWGAELGTIARHIKHRSCAGANADA